MTLFDLDALATKLTPELLSKTLETITSGSVARRLERTPEQPWGDAVVAPLHEALQTRAAEDAIGAAARKALLEMMP